MKHIVFACFGEFRRIFTDAGAILMFFGAMLIYPLFYPLPFSAEVPKKIPVAIVDMDRSQFSRQLIRMIDANESLSAVARLHDMAEAEDLFFKREINGIVVIPNQFSRDIMKGKQTRIVAYCDAGYFLLYRQVLSGVLQSAGTFSAGIEIKRMAAKGISRQQAMVRRNPLPLLPVPLFNPAGGFSTYGVPAVLFLILQQTLLMGIGMVWGTSKEHQDRTGIDINRNKHIPVVSQILGQTLAYLSIYLIHVVYISMVVFRAYQFPQHAAAGKLLLFALPFVLSIIFLAMTISSFFKTRETSIVVLLFTAIPALFLTGFSWPVESIPGWLHHLSLLIPSTSGINGLLRMICMGATFTEVIGHWIILWGLTLGYFFLVWLLWHLPQNNHFFIEKNQH